jgi:hypothetical protein
MGQKKKSPKMFYYRWGKIKERESFGSAFTRRIFLREKKTKKRPALVH